MLHPDEIKDEKIKTKVEEYSDLMDNVSQQLSDISDRLYDGNLTDAQINALYDQIDNLYRQYDSYYRMRNSVFTNSRYDNARLACNIYSTDWIAAIGLGDRISHRVDNTGKPISEGGRELGAWEMQEWLINHGVEYGWQDITTLTYEEKVDLLEKGYVFYGADGGHTWVVYGTRNSEGKILPTLTQATSNILMEYLYPESYKIKGNYNNGELIYAIKLPEVKKTESHPQDKYYVEQKFDGQCAAACVANVLTEETNKCNDEAKKELLNKLTEELEVVKDGVTSFIKLVRVMKERGFEVKTAFGYNSPEAIHKHFQESITPIFALINDRYNGKNGFNHFVLVRGIREDLSEILIHDPLMNIDKGNLLAGMKAYEKGIGVSPELWKKATTQKEGDINGQVVLIEGTPPQQSPFKRSSNPLMQNK